MTTQQIAGVILIVLPVAYNVLFTMLARSFDYPTILRQPTAEVLERFASGGSRLVLTWWGFAMSAVLLAPAVVLMSATLVGANPTVLSLATTIGVLASIVQFLGLIRWPFVIPHLARISNGGQLTAAGEEAVDITFQTLNRYLGVGVGEHLGYLFTGAWTGLAGVALIQSDVVHPMFGIVALVLVPFFLVGAFEFVGSFETRGWKVAGDIVPLAYIGWSVWLLATGIGFLLTA